MTAQIFAASLLELCSIRCTKPLSAPKMGTKAKKAQLSYETVRARYLEFLQEIFELVALPTNDPEALATEYRLPRHKLTGEVDLSKLPVQRSVEHGGGPNFIFREMDEVLGQLHMGKAKETFKPMSKD